MSERLTKPGLCRSDDLLIGMSWVQTLGKDKSGSRPRCVLLTEGKREEVAGRLEELIKLPEVTVPAHSIWMPSGIHNVSEAELGNPRKPNNMVSSEIHKLLQEWWLQVPARTPNWDIASTCRVDGETGLLLIEAKAHAGELSRKGKSFQSKSASVNSTRNHAQIGQAIEEANAGLRSATGLDWRLSRDSHYQVANRFAWAWKLATMKIPVVLVYLGYLCADEMASDNSISFDSLESWHSIVEEHSKDIVPRGCWHQVIYVNGTPLLPLIRTYYQPFQMQ